MTAGDAREALAELSELVRLTRIYHDAAILNGRPGSAQTWQRLTAQLDATRTTLIEEGDAYLGTAWAFVDSGRLLIGRGVAHDQRADAQRPSNTLGVSHLARRDDRV